jgi:hypothetical protein
VFRLVFSLSFWIQASKFSRYRLFCKKVADDCGVFRYWGLTHQPSSTDSIQNLSSRQTLDRFRAALNIVTYRSRMHFSPASLCVRHLSAFFISFPPQCSIGSSIALGLRSSVALHTARCRLYFVNTTYRISPLILRTTSAAGTELFSLTHAGIKAISVLHGLSTPQLCHRLVIFRHPGS